MNHPRVNGTFPVPRTSFSFGAVHMTRHAHDSHFVSTAFPVFWYAKDRGGGVFKKKETSPGNSLRLSALGERILVVASMSIGHCKPNQQKTLLQGFVCFFFQGTEVCSADRPSTNSGRPFRVWYLCYDLQNIVVRQFFSSSNHSSIFMLMFAEVSVAPWMNPPFLEITHPASHKEE